MLDVITVVSDSTPRGYVQECRHSVRRAAELAGYAVNIIETPGVPGNIGLAMQGGLPLGSAPWVCWVDDDDFVLPNAFRCLARHLTLKRTVAVFAREIAALANGRLVPHAHRHHLTAFRRTLLEDMPMGDYATRTSMHMRQFAEAAGETIDELSWVYVYRIWRSAHARLLERRK